MPRRPFHILGGSLSGLPGLTSWAFLWSLLGLDCIKWAPWSDTTTTEWLWTTVGWLGSFWVGDTSSGAVSTSGRYVMPYFCPWVSPGQSPCRILKRILVNKEKKIYGSIQSDKWPYRGLNDILISLLLFICLGEFIDDLTSIAKTKMKTDLNQPWYRSRLEERVRWKSGVNPTSIEFTSICFLRISWDTWCLRSLFRITVFAVSPKIRTMLPFKRNLWSCRQQVAFCAKNVPVNREDLRQMVKVRKDRSKFWRPAQSLTCRAHFQQGYLDQRPGQKEARDISPGNLDRPSIKCNKREKR